MKSFNVKIAGQQIAETIETETYEGKNGKPEYMATVIPANGPGPGEIQFSADTPEEAVTSATEYLQDQHSK